MNRKRERKETLIVFRVTESERERLDRLVKTSRRNRSETLRALIVRGADLVEDVLRPVAAA